MSARTRRARSVDESPSFAAAELSVAETVEGAMPSVYAISLPRSARAAASTTTSSAEVNGRLARMGSTNK